MKEATLQIDESVKMPAAVRAAAARSQELYDSMRGQPAEGSGEEVTPEGNPELNAATLAQGEPAQSQPTEQPTKTDTQSATAEGDESWEHKYKSMHGRYLRSQEQIRTLSEQITNLQNVMATMQATTAAPAKIPELEAEKLITPEEASDYGEDFLNVVGKKAREELAPVIKGYQAKIAELNAAYQAKFGFPFILAVRGARGMGLPKSVILQTFERRRQAGSCRPWLR